MIDRHRWTMPRSPPTPFFLTSHELTCNYTQSRSHAPIAPVPQTTSQSLRHSADRLPQFRTQCGRSCSVAGEKSRQGSHCPNGVGAVPGAAPERADWPSLGFMRRKPLTRSEQMARIRSSDTRPELLLRRALWAAGLRFRLGRPLPGRPDLVFGRDRIAIFVDGCFWHGCPLHYLRPRNRAEYWAAKLRGNVIRDRKQTATLRRNGWRVFRFWEHEVMEMLPAVVDRVLAAVQGERLRSPVGWRALRVVALADRSEFERWTLCTLTGPLAGRQVTRVRSAHMWSRSRRDGVGSRKATA
jgi:DNA mismatch endonuclease, patch repair protein